MRRRRLLHPDLNPTDNIESVHADFAPGMLVCLL